MHKNNNHYSQHYQTGLRLVNAIRMAQDEDRKRGRYSEPEAEQSANSSSGGLLMASKLALDNLSTESDLLGWYIECMRVARLSDVERYFTRQGTHSKAAEYAKRLPSLREELHTLQEKFLARGRMLDRASRGSGQLLHQDCWTAPDMHRLSQCTIDIARAEEFQCSLAKVAAIFRRGLNPRILAAIDEWAIFDGFRALQWLLGTYASEKIRKQVEAYRKWIDLRLESHHHKAVRAFLDQHRAGVWQCQKLCPGRPDFDDLVSKTDLAEKLSSTWIVFDRFPMKSPRFLYIDLLDKVGTLVVSKRARKPHGLLRLEKSTEARCWNCFLQGHKFGDCPEFPGSVSPQLPLEIQSSIIMTG